MQGDHPGTLSHLEEQNQPVMMQRPGDQQLHRIFVLDCGILRPMADRHAREPRVKYGAIKEFPRDGQFWWIRWVDGYRSPHTASSQRTVCVHLQRLNNALRETLHPDGALSVLKAPVDANTSKWVAKVTVGVIPELTIGGIYRDGVRVGTLGNHHAPFQFDLAAHPPEMVRVGDQGPEPPDWWDRSTYQYRTINRSEFHVPTLQSWCVLLRDPGRQLILLIPCQEIFRYFYAKESILARALLTGPWATTMDRVINTEHTLVRPDGSWQIVVRPGMRNDSIMHAANLTLTPEGVRAAKGIYSSLMSGGSPWHMRAEIPHPLGLFRIRAKHLMLLDDEHRKLLCTEITYAEWPHTAPIHHCRDNDPRKGENQTDTDEPPPYTGPYMDVSGMDSWHVGNTSSEDPSARGLVVTHPSPGTGWGNAPELIPIPKKESRRYKRRIPESGGETFGQTSTGEPFHGVSTSAPGTFVQGAGSQEHIVNRFEKVFSLLDRLQAEGVLQEWRALPPERTPGFILQGKEVWPVPTSAEDKKGTKRKRPWAIADKETGRPRGVLVLELVLPSGLRLYWFEVEPKILAESTDEPQEVRCRGFRSLILRSTVTDENLAEIIRAVLGICLQYRGVWPDPDELRRLTGAEAATTWVHHHKQGELSVASAAERIKELMR